MADGTPPVDIIDGIYDAALDASLWPDAVAAISAAFEGAPVAVLVNDAHSGAVPLFATAKLEPWSVDLFRRDYSTIDRNPLLQPAMTAEEGQALRLPEILGEDRYKTSAVYNDLLRPQGVRNYLSAVVLRNANVFAGFELFAPPTRREPADAEVARFEATARHIGRALKLSGYFGETPAARKSFEAALDRLEICVFLADRTGRVFWHNKAAAALLERKDGLALKCGRLAADEPADDRALVSAFIRGTDAAIRIARPSRARALVLRLHRLWHSLASPGASIAVFVKDPDRQTLSNSTLMDAFGLTEAEARIALAVSKAQGIAEAASALGLSPNTVKTTLQRIFAKTETHSQAELVRLLVSSLGL